MGGVLWRGGWVVYYSAWKCEVSSAQQTDTFVARVGYGSLGNVGSLIAPLPLGSFYIVFLKFLFRPPSPFHINYPRSFGMNSGRTIVFVNASKHAVGLASQRVAVL